MTKKNGIVKNISIVMVLTLISKIFGFLRDAVVANTFGATYQTDAYMMALTIPAIIFGMFGYAISTTFIPMLSESYKNNGKKDMYNFANSIINILIIMSVFLCIVGWIFAPQIVNIIAPKFNGNTYSLTVTLTRISIINILFLSMNSGYMAMLQTMNEFTAPALVSVVMNVPIILYIVLGVKAGVVGLTIASVIGYGMQIFVQIPWLIKYGYKYNYKINFNDKRLYKMFIYIVPVLISTAVGQLNTIVNKIVASGLVEGSVSALGFADRLNTMVYSIIIDTIITVMYPSLTLEANSINLDNFKNYLKKTINIIILIMVPVTFGIMILRVNIVNVLFKRGLFDNKAAFLTSTSLFYYAIGLTFYGIRDVFNRGFFAIKDTKTPMYNGMICILINIVLNLSLVKFMGVGGLALATSISAIVSTALLGILLTKKIGSIDSKKTLIFFLKILFSSVIMSISIIFVKNIFLNNLEGFKGEFIILVVSFILGVTVYALTIIILGIDEFRELLNKLKSKVIK